MMLSTSSRARSGVSGVSSTGVSLPCTFKHGATPAVMKRSEAFFSTILISMSLTSIGRAAVVASIGSTSGRGPVSEVVGHLRLLARGLARDQALGEQVGQALVHGLHAQLAAGLDRRVHLRNLVLADQVPDRRRAAHDLVGREAAAADLLQQRLR